MAGVEKVEIVVAHNERATLRVGDVFLKVDSDQTRTDVEVEAMAMAPIPTPEVLWRKPPVLALAASPGTALGRRRPRGDPRVVVVAKPAGGPLAGRARLRPVRARLRGRRAEIPAVRLHEPDGYECCSAGSSGPSPEARRLLPRMREPGRGLLVIRCCFVRVPGLSIGQTIGEPPTHGRGWTSGHRRTSAHRVAPTRDGGPLRRTPLSRKRGSQRG